MLSLGLSLALLAAPQGPGSVVINEFVYDDSGTDDREFVELFNATNAAVDIGGWTLDSEDPNGPNTAYTIPGGTVLQPGDYYVLGSANVPNVDQIVGTTNIWENSNESLTLRDLGGAVVDTLVYEAWRGVWNPAVAEGEGLWGNFTSIDGIETSWSRLRDGHDTDNNGRDFRVVPQTPGATNNLPSLLPLAADFDAAAIGSDVAEFGGSFKLARVVDPTVVDTLNRNAIPASPAGGNAAIFWDESGGGNSNMLLTDPTDTADFEAYVYFDAVPEAASEREIWSIGMQGGTGTFYNHPDPSGILGFTSNGNTGVAWTFEVLDTGATLYLVDHNDGGTDWKVLGAIPVLPGQNDGWQRLSLEVHGDSVIGRFGGTYGFNDGTERSGTVSGATGGFYVGYREFIVDNSLTRPPTIDALSIGSACSDLAVHGDGTGGTKLEFVLSGAEPRAPALLCLGDTTGRTVFGIGPLGTLELGLAVPFLPVFLGMTDHNGEAGLTLSIPSGLPRNALFGQGLTVSFEIAHGRPSIEFCTSDVEGFHIGG